MREEETTGSSDDIAVSPSARGDPLPIYALIGGIVAGVCLMGCVIALVAFFLLRGGDDPRSNRTELRQPSYDTCASNSNSNYDSNYGLAPVPTLVEQGAPYAAATPSAAATPYDTVPPEAQHYSALELSTQGGVSQTDQIYGTGPAPLSSGYIPVDEALIKDSPARSDV